MVNSLRGVACYDQVGSKVPCASFEASLEEGINVIHSPNGSGKSTFLTLLHPLAYAWSALGSYAEPLLRLSFVSYLSLKWPLPAVGYVELDEGRLLWYRKESLAESLSSTFGFEDLLEQAKGCQGALELEGGDYSFSGLPNTEFRFAYLGMGRACGTASHEKLVLSSDITLTEKYSAYHSPHLALVLNLLKATFIELVRYKAYTDEALEELKVVIPNLVDVRLSEGIYKVAFVVKEGGEEVELEPWSLGDGQRSLLALKALRSMFGDKRGLFVSDTPETFLYSGEDGDQLKEAVKTIASFSDSHQVVVATSKPEVRGMLVNEYQAVPYKIIKEGSEVREREGVKIVISKNKLVTIQ
ncbi:hypothetical protein IPA_07870 [Ignicoccus pacificus DSM 13166]|uniref:Uncharacterized protein n=1 Tax=Ignicoccus pacificus DSM 13166 TaxID=940294 RepID=A0A977KBS8_9CREN|nr:hypothetical protein IPA_07870 [Ignicoccus pacificus DSM 13166]